MELWQTVLDFWFGFAGGNPGSGARQRWFAKDAEFDRLVAERFSALYRAVSCGEREDWLNEPRAALAYIVVCDQFPRNMFRRSPAAFASDGRALAAARMVVGRRWDEKMPARERAFACLPYQHAEDLRCQYIALELFRGMLACPSMQSFFDSARRHFHVIARFGRFPHRNAILGRASTSAEIAFLRQHGSRF